MLGRYRLTVPALALMSVNEHHEAMTVPKDAVIDLDGKTFNGEMLMKVLWEGRTVMMFTADLRLCTIPL